MSFSDGILDRITTEQLVLPNKLVPLVFTELYVNMGDLGKKQTLQLIRDRFHWPKMEYDVTHFVTKVCSCVKRRKPHIVPAALIQSLSLAAPLKLLSLGFFHPDTCSGSY